MTELKPVGGISLVGRRVLFGILAVQQAAVLGHSWCSRNGTARWWLRQVRVWCSQVGWRCWQDRGAPRRWTGSARRTTARSRGRGCGSFGLPAGVMWRWEEVDRVVLSHADYVYKMGHYIRPLPTFVLIQKDGRSLCLTREAFAARGWISPQRFLEERCGKEKVTRDDATVPRLTVGGAYLPMWPLVFAAVLPALVLVEALGQPLLSGWGVVLPLLIGLMTELVRCRWTAIAVVVQLVVGAWGAAELSAEAGTWLRQYGVIEGLLLAVGFGWLLWWVRRGEW